MLEVFVIFAMEMCAGSAQYSRCVDWMVECQTEQAHTMIPENGAEICAENLPEWATEGM